MLKQRYGFTGKLVRKSLHTKNKRLALARARYFWLLLFEGQVLTKMAKQKSIPSLEEQDIIVQEGREIDGLISEFIRWQKGYDATHPNDNYAREVYKGSDPFWLDRPWSVILKTRKHTSQRPTT